METYLLKQTEACSLKSCGLFMLSKKESLLFVQLLSCVRLFATPRTAACQAPSPSLSPGFAQTHIR